MVPRRARGGGASTIYCGGDRYQRRLLETAWELWEHPRVAESSEMVRCLELTAPLDAVAQALSALDGQRGLKVAVVHGDFRVTSEEGRIALVRVRLEPRGAGTLAAIQLEPPPVRAVYAIAGLGLAAILTIGALVGHAFVLGAGVVWMTGIIAGGARDNRKLREQAFDAILRALADLPVHQPDDGPYRAT